MLRKYSWMASCVVGTVRLSRIVGDDRRNDYRAFDHVVKGKSCLLDFRDWWIVVPLLFGRTPIKAASFHSHRAASSSSDERD